MNADGIEDTRRWLRGISIFCLVASLLMFACAGVALAFFMGGIAGSVSGGGQMAPGALDGPKFWAIACLCLSLAGFLASGAFALCARNYGRA